MTEADFPKIHVMANILASSLLSPTAEVVRQFSSERPALLRLGVTNEDTTRRTFQCGVPEPFGDVQNDASDEYRMCLIPEDEEGVLHDSEDSPIVPSEPDDGCWRVRPNWGDSQILSGFRLRPGESFTNEYVVLAAPDSEECLPPQDYHFETTLQTGDEEMHWKLTIAVQ